METSKTEKTILIGGSGSGKDFLMRKLVEKGLKPCVKSTTRPKRKFEKQGIAYNFLNINEFNDLINEDHLIVYESFNVKSDNNEEQLWYYGITKNNFESSDVCIMTVSEFKSLPLEIRENCFVVFLDINRSIRESRLHQREDKNDSVKRRLDADEIDFKDFKDYDLKITDPEFTADDIYELIN